MIKVIVDTDIGEDIDDIWSLVYMLANPEIDVRLICVSCGYTDYQSKIVAKILQIMGKTDIPIVRGLPLRLGSFPSERFVRDFRLDAYPGTITDDVVAAFEKTADGETTIVELGPMTNLSYVLKNLPEIGEKCAVLAMAGAVYKGYANQDEVRSEYNIAIDVGGALNVFRACKRLTLMPLDVCREFILAGAYYRALAESEKTPAKIVMENYAIWQCDYRGGAIQYDEAVSTSILYDMLPPLFLQMRDRFECRELKLSIDRTGRTVEDAEGYDVVCGIDVKDMDALYRKAADIFTK